MRYKLTGTVTSVVKIDSYSAFEDPVVKVGVLVSTMPHGSLTVFVPQKFHIPCGASVQITVETLEAEDE